MTGLEGVLGVVIAGSGVVTGLLGLKLKPLEQKDTDNEEALKETKKSFDERLKGIHDDAKEEREKFERRIAAVEVSYVSRTELERVINSLGERMDRGLARVEAGMTTLGAKVDHLTERVSKVEVVRE